MLSSRATSKVKVPCEHEAIKAQTTKEMELEMELKVYKEGRSNGA